MNLEEFHAKLTVSLLMVMGKGFKSRDVDVSITDISKVLIISWIALSNKFLCIKKLFINGMIIINAFI